jgi:hypothetical protein
MYSQNNEEETILRKFQGETGAFLDLGAYDGIKLSNTRALFELGWSGALIDGSSFSFSRLFDLYSGRNEMLLINAMVTNLEPPIERIQKMWEAPHSGVSTIDQKNYEKWKNEKFAGAESYSGFREIYVPVVTIREILDIVKDRFKILDFVSIDIEGSSASIAMKFDPDEFSTRMVCVEHDSRIDEIVEYYNKYGFSVSSANQENIIMER